MKLCCCLIVIGIIQSAFANGLNIQPNDWIALQQRMGIFHETRPRSLFIQVPSECSYPNPFQTVEISCKAREFLAERSRLISQENHQSKSNRRISELEDLQNLKNDFLENEKQLDKARSKTPMLKVSKGQVRIFGNGVHDVQYRSIFKGSRVSSIKSQILNDDNRVMKKFVASCLDIRSANKDDASLGPIKLNGNLDIDFSQSKTELSQTEKNSVLERFKAYISASNADIAMLSTSLIMTNSFDVGVSVVNSEANIVYYDINDEGMQTSLLHDYKNFNTDESEEKLHKWLKEFYKDLPAEAVQYIKENRAMKLCFVAMVRLFKSSCNIETIWQDKRTGEMGVIKDDILTRYIQDGEEISTPAPKDTLAWNTLRERIISTPSSKFTSTWVALMKRMINNNNIKEISTRAPMNSSDYSDSKTQSVTDTLNEKESKDNTRKDEIPKDETSNAPPRKTWLSFLMWGFNYLNYNISFSFLLQFNIF